MDKKADSSNLSWYSEDGRDNDVVLSTRLRLARNLASFLFLLTSEGMMLTVFRLLYLMLFLKRKILIHFKWSRQKILTKAE